MSLSRVLVVHSSAELYGSDRQVLESVRALQARGCATVVALPEPGPLVALLEATGADVHIVPTLVLRKADMSPLGIVKVAVNAARVARHNVRLLKQVAPQLVYVNSVNSPLWLPLARLLHLPAVCHVHEAEDALPRPVALALALPLLLARRVVVNSAAALQVLLASCPQLAGRSVVVYNGVPGPPAGAVPLPDAPGEPPRLVLVGRLSARKGTDVAIAAAAELQRRGRPVCLHLVGSAAPGGEAYVEELRAQVAQEGLSDQVVFGGFADDVWPHLAASDIVLVPSRLEPFGNVAVEAALAGRPVVAARVQGLQEIVRDAETGLLVGPGDSVALADGVEELLLDWPGTTAMARAAETDAGLRFGLERYGDELLAVLEQAIAPAPTTRADPVRRDVPSGESWLPSHRRIRG